MTHKHDLDEPVLTRLDQVPRSCVRRLWPGRIPLGKTTLLAGETVAENTAMNQRTPTCTRCVCGGGDCRRKSRTTPTNNARCAQAARTLIQQK